jgi:hypothetical protein
MVHDSTPRAEIKIFGERNTGTNALKQLIETNSDSRVLPSIAKELDPRFTKVVRLLARLPFKAVLREAYTDHVFSGRSPRLSWKHTATEFGGAADFSECAVILTTRHPASWLLALHRRPYHAAEKVSTDFSEFLTTKWKPVRRDNLSERFVTPVEMWNVKMRSYMSLARQLSEQGVPFVWLRFEDFVVDQSAAFERIRGFLLSPAESATAVDESTKDKSKSYQYYRNYYGRALWLNEIDERSLGMIDRSVDWEIAGLFDYRPLADLSADIDGRQPLGAVLTGQGVAGRLTGSVGSA